jgi:hypothetical protein
VLHLSVPFTALVLLQRLKARFPTARVVRPSPIHLGVHHCLKSHVRRHLFEQVLGNRRPRHVHSSRDQPERCAVTSNGNSPSTSKRSSSFETMVKRDFNGPGPYPTYLHSVSSNRTENSEASQPFSSSISPLPSFGHVPAKDASPPPNPIQQQPHQPHVLLLR